MKKLDYYIKLRSLGIKEKHALSMASQSSKDGREEADDFETASEAIVSFADWNYTIEGTGYWEALYDKAWENEKCA